MSRKTEMTTRTADSFPRVSGDEPRVRKCGLAESRFSPRERG